MATLALVTAMGTTYTQQVGKLSLHTADPGTTGANELTGGVPAYARQVPVWTVDAATGKATGTATFQVPANTVFTHIGMWSAADAFLDSVAYSFGQGASQDTVDVTVSYTYQAVAVA